VRAHTIFGTNQRAKILTSDLVKKEKNGEANVPAPRFYFFGAFFFAAFFLATSNASGFYLCQ